VPEKKDRLAQQGGENRQRQPASAQVRDILPVVENKLRGVGIGFALDQEQGEIGQGAREAAAQFGPRFPGPVFRFTPTAGMNRHQARAGLESWKERAADVSSGEGKTSLAESWERARPSGSTMPAK
jgi:hypothetical protein